MEEKNNLMLMVFSATWCNPCQTMEPVLEELKNRVGEKVHILKVDVDKTPQAIKAFNIRSVPTFILFKDTELLWRKSGIISPNKLERLIRRNYSA